MKEKKKLKKGALFLLLFVIIILVLGIGGFYLYQIKGINNKYSKYISVTKKANLYDKNKKVVGTLYQDYPVELEKSAKNGYYKIKDTSYYISYKDCHPEKERVQDALKENQINLNKGIKSTKEVSFYRDSKRVLTLSSIDFPVSYESKDSYYVSFQNQFLEIRKEESIQEYELEKSIDGMASHVSVLYYERVLDNCNDSNCILTSNFRNQMNELIQNHYYFIDQDTFDNYLDGYIELKDKAIFLTTSNVDGPIDSIVKELKIPVMDVSGETNIKFFSTNKAATSKMAKSNVNRYQIKNTTSLESIIKMAQGEVFPIEVDRQGIAVLNYHFFYNPEELDPMYPSIYERCDESICLTVQKFREHLNYFQENHFKTLTMEEFRKWMYGEIDLPTKSVLITVDDGARGTGKHNGNRLIPLLEEYKMNATLFLITGWWNVENYVSPYLTIQSHTNNMHQYGPCKRGELNCATYEEAVADLKESLRFVWNTDSFCFPFYMYSDTSLKAVQDVGFQLAFVGGNRKATRQSNKFLVPRYPIVSDVTLDYIKTIVN